MFNKLEYHVAENTAKALGVEQPFVETATGVRTGSALKTTLREYQKDRNLKPTGALNTDTIRELAMTNPSSAAVTGSQPTEARKPAAASGR